MIKKFYLGLFILLASLSLLYSAEDYISQYYTWVLGDTITESRLNGNVSNVTDGLSGGTKAINIGKILVGDTEVLNASREITLTKATVDYLVFNGNDISSSTGDITITPYTGNDIILDGHWEFDGGELTGLTNVNSTINAYVGKQVIIESVTFDGGNVTANTLTDGTASITGGAGSGFTTIAATTVNATSLAGTLSTAAQPNITSVGNLTSLTSSGTITGNKLTDGTASITGGAGSGFTTLAATTVNATSLAGTLSTAAQPNITSVGNLSNLNVSGTVTGNKLTDGTISMTGGNLTGATGVTATTVTTAKVQAASGAGLQLFEDGGKGITILDNTGDINMNGNLYLATYMGQWATSVSIGNTASSNISLGNGNKIGILTVQGNSSSNGNVSTMKSYAIATNGTTVTFSTALVTSNGTTSAFSYTVTDAGSNSVKITNNGGSTGNFTITFSGQTSTL